MAIGTAAAIAIAAGAATSAAGSIYSAKKQAGAAKEGARVQQDAAREAGQRADQMYRQQTALMSPYINMGGSAASTLGRLMGAPAGSMFASGPPQQAPGLDLSMFGMAGGGAQPRAGMPMSRSPMRYASPEAAGLPPPQMGAPPQQGMPQPGGSLAMFAGPQMPQGGPPPGMGRPPQMPQGMDPRMRAGQFLNLADFARAA